MKIKGLCGKCILFKAQDVTTFQDEYKKYIYVISNFNDAMQCKTCQNKEECPVWKKATSN